MNEEQIKSHYFFIGTEAELIKILPILLEFEKRKASYKIIASGQNNIQNSVLFTLLKKNKPDIILYHGKIEQTAAHLFFWFSRTLVSALFTLKKEFHLANKSNTRMVIHGDTVSTVMGALIGKYYGLEIAHVEAGLRSFNLFHPFPEEIDRIIASRFTNIHFCPNEWAVNNLKKREGIKINTEENTLLDSLNLVINIKARSPLLEKLNDEKFFLFIMHRQENLFNRKLVNTLTDEIRNSAKKINCVFIMHKPTKLVLEKLGILTTLKNDPNIILSDRQSYINFMKLLDKCEFIVTDGGSNQEESYYFGKPCLILRTATERQEGLGKNVVLSKNKLLNIQNFLDNPYKYKRKAVSTKVKPGKIIADYLLDH